MDAPGSIVITGAAGFIASCLTSALFRDGKRELILVDDFEARPDKQPNWDRFHQLTRIDRDVFPEWLQANGAQVSAVYHLGARTDTTEMDYSVHERLNLRYSQAIWKACAVHGIPLVYASSAATYGDGAHGYSDDHDTIGQLKPLNPYGLSKHQFDLWALAQAAAPPFWAGVKFFNVYGPNEYHKGRMASVMLHAFRQVKDAGFVRLFRSHRPDFTDGGQMRDFVYVQDVVSMVRWLMDARPSTGIYNVGSGKARSFLDLATAIFDALSQTPDIRFIDTPEDIRDTYQYFTEADMRKMRAAGYAPPTTSLEAGIENYVTEFLVPGTYF